MSTKIISKNFNANDVRVNYGNCPNCDTPIEVHHTKCSYCGTPYRIEHHPTSIQIEFFDPAVDIYGVSLCVDNLELSYLGEDFKYAIKDRIARALAEELAANIELDYITDNDTDTTRVKGNIRVLKNDYKF